MGVLDSRSLFWGFEGAKADSRESIKTYLEDGASSPPTGYLEGACSEVFDSNMDKETLVKLVSRISQLVNDISFGRRASLLAQCKKMEGEENGGDFRVQYQTQDRSVLYAFSYPFIICKSNIATILLLKI